MSGASSVLARGRVQREGLNGRRIDRCYRHFVTFRFQRKTFSVAGFGTSSRCLEANSQVVHSCPLISVSRVGLPSVMGPCARIGVGNCKVTASLLSFLANIPCSSYIIFGRIVRVPKREGLLHGLRTGTGHRNSVPSPDGHVTGTSVRRILSELTISDAVLICYGFGVLIDYPPSGIAPMASFLRAGLCRYNVVPSEATCGRLRLFVSYFPNGNCTFGPSCSLFLALSSTTLYFFFGRRLGRSRSAPLAACCASHRKLPIYVSVANGRNGGGVASGTGFFYVNPSNSNGSFRVGDIMHRLLRRGASIIVISANSSCRNVYKCCGNACVTCSGRGPVSVGPFGIAGRRCRLGFNRGGGFLGSLVFLVFGKGTFPAGVRSVLVGRAVIRCCRTCFGPFRKFDSDRHRTLERGLLITTGVRSSCRRFARDVRSVSERVDARRIRRGTRDHTLLLPSRMHHLGLVQRYHSLATLVGSRTTARSRGRHTLTVVRGCGERLCGGSVLVGVSERVSRVRRRGHELGIRRLSFGSCCRFTLRHVPRVARLRGVDFGVRSFTTVLGRFCHNNRLRVALGSSLGVGLFSRHFVIFRVSGVGSSPMLFPVIILVVVSIFLRGVHVGGKQGTLVVRRT